MLYLSSLCSKILQLLSMPLRLEDYYVQKPAWSSHYSHYCYTYRLEELLKNELVDDFVHALELLSSPELIFKVGRYRCRDIP